MPTSRCGLAETGELMNEKSGKICIFFICFLSCVVRHCQKWRCPFSHVSDKISSQHGQNRHGGKFGPITSWQHTEVFVHNLFGPEICRPNRRSLTNKTTKQKHNFSKMSVYSVHHSSVTWVCREKDKINSHERYLVTTRNRVTEDSHKLPSISK